MMPITQENLKLICNILAEKSLSDELIQTIKDIIFEVGGLVPQKLQRIANIVYGHYHCSIKMIEENLEDGNGRCNIHYIQVKGKDIYTKTFVYYYDRWLWTSPGEIVEQNWGIYE